MVGLRLEGNLVIIITVIIIIIIIKFYIEGIGIFYLFYSCDLDLDSIIFMNELDPYPVKMYWRAKNELLTSRL